MNARNSLSAPQPYVQQPFFSNHEEAPPFSLDDWLDSLPPLDFQPRIILDALNQPQRTAVTHGSGPVLVIAGAGTGKTRTLVYRVAWLLEQGIDPESILLLTFTRKAAQEMLDRAAQLSCQACRVQGGTFHSAANLLLRRHGHHLGINSDFSIIDQSDAEGIIGLVASSLWLSGSGRRFPGSRTVFGFISSAVNKNCSIEDAIQRSHPHLVDFSNDCCLILEHYTDFKTKHGLMDYDDLLLNLFQLLLNFPVACREISSRFQHVLVDEYQDTNWLQSMIVKLLSSEHGNVMVVGDDAQSIYSFRGADFQNIMSFPQYHPDCTIIKLEQNYRSTPPILDFTNAIISNFREKYAKKLFTALPGSIMPALYAASNETDEARFITGKIKKLISSGVSCSEIAVLFRASHHAYKLELELASARISFEKWGGMKLTESAHVKDVLSILRILVNPHDRLSWHRLLLQIEKIGPIVFKF
ncbi:ATP-dependent helicase [Desulfobulbus sp. F5]|nr:ATP-dependent helicase [Desulfobulbus sp. F5]